MKDEIDFRPYICEAIRLNGWDSRSCPVTPNMLTTDKFKLKELIVGDYTLNYTIESDSFLLANTSTFEVFTYSVDSLGQLKLADNMKNSKEESKEKFMFMTGDEVMKEIDPVCWLISDWIPKGKGLIQLYGASGTGKSFLAIDWILSIVTGMAEWNSSQCSMGKCAYLCGEGQRGIRKRFLAWMQMHGMAKDVFDRYLHDNLRVLQSSAQLTLDNASQIEDMQMEWDREMFKPNLIVVDTLNRFMDGNENDTRDSTAFVHACDSLSSKYDCAVILIHHIGWSQDAQTRARGSSVIHSSVDLDMMLQDKGGTLELTQTKNKDFEKANPVYLKLRQVALDNEADTDGKTLYSAVLVSAERPEISIIKDSTRIRYENLCLDAFKEHGTECSDGTIQITHERFKDYCKGKLFGKDGNPLEGTVFTNQFNQNQKGRFLNKLCQYGVVMCSDDSSRPEHLTLTDGELIEIFKEYRYEKDPF